MNKRQVLIIHGGDFFDSREDFFVSLKKEEVGRNELFGIKEKRWKDRLAEDLGEGYELLLPRMPLAEHARYDEWKFRFEQMIPFLRDGIILIGTSLGGIFLERYLSENKFPKKIRALFLLAAPYFEDRHSAGFYTVSPERLLLQVTDISLYHSKDDDIVPFVHAGKYQKILPGAELVALEGRGHLYAQERFPELVEAIKNL